MTGDQPSILSRRRATTKAVNYNEKDADAELVKRIEQLEEYRSANQDNKPKRGRGGGIATNCSANSTDKLRYQKYLSDKSIGWNFIPSLPSFFRKASRFSTVLDLEGALLDVREQCIYNQGSVLMKANDTIYMISEPPGEPYYIGRVVEFICKPEFRSIITKVKLDTERYPVKFFEVRMNWFYRPRDIQNRVNNLDPRLLYASLHQDICPIESYRGKCSVFHEDDLNDSMLNSTERLTKPNNFYFNHLFDRYTRKYYKVVSTKNLLELQADSPFLRTLSKRFRYIYFEENYRLDEVIQKYVLEEGNATSREDVLWNERCSVCREWCTKPLSLKCDECTQGVHLYCMDPPLDRKPNKGVIWLCFGCLKRQEGTVQALKEAEEDDLGERSFFDSSRKDLNDIAMRTLNKSGPLNQKCCWMQYIGRNMINHLSDLMHEGVFFPYPMKYSRIGCKYQWSGCLNDDDIFPQPYSTEGTGAVIERGTERTSDLLWKMNNAKSCPGEVDSYLERCKAEIPPKLDMLPESCNFLDMAVTMLMNNDFDAKLAFQQCCNQASRESLQEPTFTAEEVMQFERAISEYGSELLPVSKCVKTQPMSMIVRYYYYWKKTPSGRSIWGCYKGRKKNAGKKASECPPSSTNPEERKSGRERKPTKLALESQIPNSQSDLKHVDDSSFETEKLFTLKKYFHCMFCEIDYSPMWYKVTGGSDDDYIKTRMQTGVNERTETSGNNLLSNAAAKSKNKERENENEKVDALCMRCARLWRRYGVKWEHPLKVLKKLNGPSVASLHATLELIFSESSVPALRLSPQQARNKLIEWELVQDAELISSQREEMMKDPERLAKLKKNTMASRPQLFKMVKRPFDRTVWTSGHMIKELTEYMENHRSKNQAPKNISAKDKNRIGKICKAAHITKGYGTIDKKRKESEKNKASLVHLKNIGAVKLAINRDIHFKLSNKDEDIGKITIDSDGEYFQIDDKIYAELMCHMRTLKRVRSMDPSSEVFTFKRARLATFDDINNFSNRYQRSKKPSLGVCENTSDTTKLLGMYHKLNPFYVNWYNMVGTESMTSLRSTPVKHQEFEEKKLTELVGCCCVCGEKFSDSVDEEIICQSCGLRVHHYCYGVSLPYDLPMKMRLKDFKWLCDPCSNNLHPIVSTDYRCDLCQFRKCPEIIAKGQQEPLKLEALKCTTVGSWVHVICAVYNVSIKFVSSKFLQPILNTKFVLAEGLCQTCSICKLQGGGIIKCEVCCTRFHASCAYCTPGFELRIKKIALTDLQKNEPGVLLPDGKLYVLNPVAFCREHQQELSVSDDLFFPLNWKFASQSETLLQLFCKHYKSCNQTSTVYARYIEQQSALRGGLRPDTEERTRDIVKKGAMIKIKTSFIPEANTCSRCGTHKAIFWYGDICHVCHVSQKLHQEKSTDISESQIAEHIQIVPRISEAVTATLLEGIVPLKTEVKTEKSNKTTKTTDAKDLIQKTRWIKENPGK